MLRFLNNLNINQKVEINNQIKYGGNQIACTSEGNKKLVKETWVWEKEGLRIQDSIINK